MRCLKVSLLVILIGLICAAPGRAPAADIPTVFPEIATECPQVLTVCPDPPPVADAGGDLWGFESRGSAMYIVTLDGTGSSGAATYRWQQVANGGLGVVLRNAATATAGFDAPQWDGTTELTVVEASLLFRLTINEGLPGEDADECACYIRIPGDSNGDDVVNAFDLAAVRTLDPSADFTGDGTVNAFDLGVLRRNSARRRLL